MMLKWYFSLNNIKMRQLKNRSLEKCPVLYWFVYLNFFILNREILTEPIRDFWIPVFLKWFLILRFWDSRLPAFQSRPCLVSVTLLLKLKAYCTKLKMQKIFQVHWRQEGGRRIWVLPSDRTHREGAKSYQTLFNASFTMWWHSRSIGGFDNFAIKKTHQLTANFAIVWAGPNVIAHFYVCS